MRLVRSSEKGVISPANAETEAKVAICTSVRPNQSAKPVKIGPVTSAICVYAPQKAPVYKNRCSPLMVSCLEKTACFSKSAPKIVKWKRRYCEHGMVGQWSCELSPFSHHVTFGWCIASSVLEWLTELQHAFGWCIPSLRRIVRCVEIALNANFVASLPKGQQAAHRYGVYFYMVTG